MRHTTTDEETSARAALHALGALDEQEARDFEEHVAAGCDVCAAELREFRCVAADLALAATPAQPPALARSRLLALAAEEGRDGQGQAEEGQTQSARVGAIRESEGAGEESAEGESDVAGSVRESEGVARADDRAFDAQRASVPSGFLIVRAGEGEWRETEDRGVSFKLLFVDRERATVTTLLRMEPGARIPRHRHLGVEQCLVLEGDVRSGPYQMAAGDFNCSLPGSIHDELVTDGGALLLLVSPERYETLDERAS